MAIVPHSRNACRRGRRLPRCELLDAASGCWAPSASSRQQVTGRPGTGSWLLAAFPWCRKCGPVRAGRRGGAPEVLLGCWVSADMVSAQWQLESGRALVCAASLLSIRFACTQWPRATPRASGPRTPSDAVAFAHERRVRPLQEEARTPQAPANPPGHGAAKLKCTG